MILIQSCLFQVVWSAIYPRATRLDSIGEKPTFAEILPNDVFPDVLQRENVGVPPQILAKNGLERRLETKQKKCEKSSECGANEYCMSCKKCEEYAKTLRASESRQWNCSPCFAGENSGYCENAKYCNKAKDAMENACSQYPGCENHTECEQDEYCFACDKCETFKLSNPHWDCEPCPTAKAGFCGMLSRCSEGTDSIDQVCPQFMGCDQHSDCGYKQYCKDCSKCDDFLLGLNEEEAASWNCGTCPTKKGGICGSERLCLVASDSIDNTCPISGECSTHGECSSTEYCMSCNKCAAYQNTLDDPYDWSCSPCPTEKSGLCQIQQFCAVANDAIDDKCPEFHGCSQHSDCTDTPNSFCMSYDACIDEKSEEKCGVRPSKGGYCVSTSYCTVERSITKKCDDIVRGCDHHKQCVDGQFCTRWKDCINTRGADVCGMEPSAEGICVDNSHCVIGLHTPIDGKCPLIGSRARPTLNTREAFDLDGVELATFHQAMNVWYDEETKEERLVFQIHDYSGHDTNFDDREYFASYKVEGSGTMTKEWKTETSCPFVEIIVPHRGPYVYETRIATPLKHHDELIATCSCLKGDFPWVTQGACPRGVALSKNAPERVLNCYFVDTTLMPVETKSTLYTMDRELTGLAYFLDGSEVRCPVSEETGEPYDLNVGCKQIEMEGKKIAEVQGKWCVVNTEGCAVTMKYRLCRASGAIGVAVLAEDNNMMDLALTIILRDAVEECAGDPIPAVFLQGFDAMTMSELMAGDLEITIGPDVPLAKPRAGHTINSGGIRVFDSVSKEWINHFEVFGAVKYVETSLLRDILFACVGEPSKLRVFDISPYVMDTKKHGVACAFQHAHETILPGVMTLDRCKHICALDRLCMAVNVMMEGETYRCGLMLSKTPVNPATIEWVDVYKDLGFIFPEAECFRKIEGPLGPAMRELVGNAPACERGRTRDYHLVDFGRDGKSHTALVNPEDNNNRLFVYDTTDLREWMLVETVHANWEDADSGLGQVVGSPGGDNIVVTWHCSNRFCDGSFGHNAYVLDVASPDNGVGIKAKLQLPMKEGTVAKDVGCNADDLCLIAMNHDGLSLLDLSADNGPQIIASHLETFNNDTIPVPVYRMFSGAQKVYSSKQNTNRWYVERSELDWDKVTAGIPLSLAISSDTVYIVDLAPKYDRNQVHFAVIDPIAIGILEIALGWEDIQKIASDILNTDLDAEDVFEAALIRAACMSLKVSDDRFKVTSMKFEEKNTKVRFQIIPGIGPSPDTLFRMLQVQLSSEHSEIHNTAIGPLIGFITLSREYSTMDSVLGNHKPIVIENRVPAGTERLAKPGMSAYGAPYDNYEEVLALSVVCGLTFVCLVTTLIFIYLRLKKARRLHAELEKKLRSGTSGLLTDHSTIVGAQLDDGYVIGRPATGAARPSDSRKGDGDDKDHVDKGKGTPEPDNIRVVGEPVRGTLPSTQTITDGRNTRGSTNTTISRDTAVRLDFDKR